MKRTIHFLLPLLFTILFFSSCDDLDGGNDQIIDETGISVRLEWTVQNSTVFGPDEADLDLRLLNNQALVEYSTSAFQYEELDFASSHSDGLYELEITTDGVKDVNYTIYIEGLSTFQTLQFSGTAPVSVGSYQITPLSINKTDNGNFTFN